ncbi:ABC transporter ATP-binding protein/permease [Oscillochloris sp. ZM17-4]|uniref:ABC transporter ATP-binding protein n=1 Tax=Oscillochloris sp. ZM17-4 TaxID=2866714 RepID=UPI001C735536|nr:ABC transporter ATP-binding protein [Oscillochloris sp. ZM17-4]MBX0329053.1 ABC transporter ATP-binding protein/permease [Oscillochloris sp. ZM17-4]
MSGQKARKKPSEQSQDAALLWLLLTTAAPHWRYLLLAGVMLAVAAGLNVLPPYLLQQAIDGPIARGDAAGLWPLALSYGGVAVGAFVLQYGQVYALQMAGQRALSDLRVRLLEHMLRQGQGFFGKHPVGDLVARIVGDIDSLNALLSSSVVIILTESVTLVAIIIVMFSVNWALALISLAVLPVLLAITIYFRRRIRRSSTGERTALARTSSFLNEQIQGMLLVQLFGRQAASDQQFDGYNSAYRRALVNLRFQSAVFLSVLEVLSAFGMAALLYGGGQGVLAGWATIGTLVAFVQYTERAFQPILRLSEQYNSVQIGLGAAERIQRTLLAKPSIGEPARPAALPHIRGAVEFRDVQFSYLPGEPVLRGVSLRIPPGQNVAVVGATGAGKSSLVGLLARFYDPQGGAVSLDGVNIRDLALADLRRAVAVVPQDPVCLAGSIAMNIRLYRDDISDEAMRRAAREANADRFINQLPGGYDYEVLPGGANLSVGQRQLLALARALCLSPEGVLVLDEATSSIDTATETLIQEALGRILRARTSIVIAHRLSTVRRADRIIVMHQGQIIEDGSPDELLASDGAYARLSRHQLATRPE